MSALYSRWPMLWAQAGHSGPDGWRRSIRRPSAFRREWLTDAQVALSLERPDGHDRRPLGRGAHLAQGDQPGLPGRAGSLHWLIDRRQGADRSAGAAGSTTWAWPPSILTPVVVMLRESSSPSNGCRSTRSPIVSLGLTAVRGPDLHRSATWSGSRSPSGGRSGDMAGRCDLAVVLLGIHLALARRAWPAGRPARAEGISVSSWRSAQVPTLARNHLARRADLRRADRRDVHGVRRPGAGGACCLVEVIAVRGRRLYSIARLSIYESNRRMWAPWVVITVFLLVLAFTHWFLQPPRPAEMGRLYVGTLSLALLGPADRDGDDPDAAVAADGHPAADDLHGRLQAGAAARADLGPDDRLHGARDGAGRASSAGSACSTCGGRSAARSSRPTPLAVKAKKENRMTDAKLLTEQADQLRTRMSARVPIKGSLSFLDSRGMPHAMGIDVGAGAVDEGAAEPHRGGDAIDGDLELRHRARPVHAAGPAADACSTGASPSQTSSSPARSNGSSTASTSSRRRSKAPRTEKAQPNVPAARRRRARRGDRPQSGGARAGPCRVRRPEQTRRRPGGAGGRGRGRGQRETKASNSRRERPTLSLAADHGRDDASTSTGRPRGRSASRSMPRFRRSTPAPAAEFEGDVFPIKEYYTNRVPLPAVDPGRLGRRACGSRSAA